jgi:NADH:ubiquinone oxidoreductase subunit C
MINSEQALATAVSLLAPWAKKTDTPAAGRVDVTLEAENLVTAVAALVDNQWGYLAAITGLDLGLEESALEVLYHFCEGAAVLTLRVRTPYSVASVPSVCGLIPSATFFERELHEMFGIEVVDTPNDDYLFLPETWPEGVFPLRKNYLVTSVEERCLIPLPGTETT